MRFLALLAVALPAAAALPACSSSSNPSTDGACTAYVVPSTFDPTKPTVSLKNDLEPIFHQACAFSSCHGSETGGNQAGVYLGVDTAKILTTLVGVPAQNYGSMPRVTAGDASKSYLMHKLDDDACALPNCTGTCANSMPADTAPSDRSQLLTVDQRDAIRRWIDQGAQND